VNSSTSATRGRGSRSLIVLRARKRPGVPGKSDDGERTKDRVDGAALEAELTQVGAGEKSTGRLEQVGGGWRAHDSPSAGFPESASAPLRPLTGGTRGAFALSPVEPV